jgi:hypothetical protein
MTPNSHRPKPADPKLPEAPDAKVAVEDNAERDAAAWVALTEQSFAFWDNEEDAVYDAL